MTYPPTWLGAMEDLRRARRLLEAGAREMARGLEVEVLAPPIDQHWSLDVSRALSLVLEGHQKIMEALAKCGALTPPKEAGESGGEQ